jgi:hypothetical protein
VRTAVREEPIENLDQLELVVEIVLEPEDDFVVIGGGGLRRDAWRCLLSLRLAGGGNML